MTINRCKEHIEMVVAYDIELVKSNYNYPILLFIQ